MEQRLQKKEERTLRVPNKSLRVNSFDNIRWKFQRGMPQEFQSGENKQERENSPGSFCRARGRSGQLTSCRHSWSNTKSFQKANCYKLRFWERQHFLGYNTGTISKVENEEIYRHITANDSQKVWYVTETKMRCQTQNVNRLNRMVRAYE